MRIINKFVFLPLVIIFSLLFVFSYKAKANLLAHWSFDQVKGGSIEDNTGNSNGKVLRGNAENYLRPGLYGNALYFGDMRNSNTIEVKNSAAISLTDNFTFECVIKPDKVDGFRTIMWKGDRNIIPETIGYYFDLRDGKPEMKFKDEKGKWTVYSTPTAVIDAGQWYHLIFTKKGRTVDIYVNGKKYSVKKSEDGEGKNLLPNKYNAYIGSGASAKIRETYMFEGLIDDIKIYRGINIEFPNDYQQKWQQLIDENKRRTHLFNIKQEEIEVKNQKKIRQEYFDFFERQASKKNAPFTVGVLPPTKRLVKETDFFKKVNTFRKVAEISAARNEYEGFNIITFGNPSKEIQIDKVEVSDLISSDKSRIPSSNITSGYIKDIITKDPDIPVEFVGAIPDVIMNGTTSFKVEKNSFTPVFIKIYTGNALSGNYKGTVTLTGNNYSETIDINLRVYNFTLPKKGSLRTAFSFFENYYKEWYGVKEIPTKQREYNHDFLLSYRLSPNNIYSHDPVHPGIEYLKRIKDQTNFFTIRGYSNSKLVSEEILQRQIDSVRENVERVKAAGLWDDMYYYSYDEITRHSTSLPPERLAAATQINAVLQKEFPDLRLMQTSFPEEKIKGLFNVWINLFNLFDSKENTETFKRLKERGDEIWWYATTMPSRPYPNFFLDYPVFDNRIIATLSYIHDVDGILYWSINREWLTNMDIREQWPYAVWKPYTYNINTGVKVYKHGMGNFIYPGPSGTLFPSVRLENLRDGLEDYEYLRGLKKSVEALEKADTKNKKILLEEAKKLVVVPDSIAISIGNWSSDSDAFLTYRNRIGEIISKINSELDHKE